SKDIYNSDGASAEHLYRTVVLCLQDRYGNQCSPRTEETLSRIQFYSHVLDGVRRPRLRRDKILSFIREEIRLEHFAVRCRRKVLSQRSGYTDGGDSR